MSLNIIWETSINSFRESGPYKGNKQWFIRKTSSLKSFPWWTVLRQNTWNQTRGQVSELPMVNYPDKQVKWTLLTHKFIERISRDFLFVLRTSKFGTNNRFFRLQSIVPIQWWFRKPSRWRSGRYLRLAGIGDWEPLINVLILPEKRWTRWGWS